MPRKLVSATRFERATSCSGSRRSRQAELRGGVNRELVGVTGFEPATSCSQGTRSNQAELHPGMFNGLPRDLEAARGDCLSTVLQTKNVESPTGLEPA